MPRSVFIVPAVAGVIMFVGTIGYAIGGAIGLFECDYGDQVSTDVMAWSFLWVGLALLTSGISAGRLAARLNGRLALAGTLLTLVAIVLGAELSWAMAGSISGCQLSDEGPALTLIIFGTAGALFGYIIGWVLRQARTRGSTG
jgi:hypothetical protein